MEVSNSKETNSNPWDTSKSLRSPKSSLTAAKSTVAAASGIHSSSSSGVKKSNTCSMNNNNNNNNNHSSINVEDELILDISEKRLELDLLEKADGRVEELYLYRNAFSLVPSSVGRLGRLRTLKFFGNEVNLFPAEFENLVGLECLQVKVSSLGLNGLNFSKFKELKELELSKVPPRPSVLTVFSQITGLKCLTRLSVCHFSIRYIPPEIGCLKNLEYLDLSFNKIKSLPSEIGHLDALISLKVANNKLVELPSGLSSLQKLESLDLSNNRLTSLGSLEFSLMQSLQFLNLQYNKLLSFCQIPPWICCCLEGNGKDFSTGDFIGSSIEMDVYETPTQEDDRKFSCSNHSASNLSIGSSSSSRCFAARRSCKRWKRQHYLQERAHQEQFSSRTKRKGEVCDELLALNETGNSKSDNLDVTLETHAECASDIISLDDDDKEVLAAEIEGESLPISFEAEKISSEKGFCVESGSCNIESQRKGKEVECYVPDRSSASIGNGAIEEDGVSSSEVEKTSYKYKRHSDRDLDNPKPCKYRRPMEDSSNTSCKYSNLSFISIEDSLPDGFYDAGRDRPFLPLSRYEQILDLDSREVILLDRDKDEELNAITISAQALVSRLKRLNCSKGRNKYIDDLQIASLLALFVSDHFGGSDRSMTIERTRKAVSGSNYRKPFFCTCSTGNSDSIAKLPKQILDPAEDIFLSDICEKSLRSIKARKSSVVVPLGSLQFGVCRHRSLLMKYLCDRMEPPIPCELVRGYLDFLPHAWNTILTKKGDSLVRMVVDACFPLDIREETNPEYFCRYLPLSRSKIPFSSEGIVGPSCSFPSFSTCDEIEKAVSSTLIRCKLGSVDAAAKVRTLEVCGASMDSIRKFEYKCLGEVRILGALQHPCIVEMYGHQILSKWISSEDKIAERRILQSAIFLEHVKEGSLKNYIEKVAQTGDKRISLDLALCIARDIAWALAELHSKHIIHRDIKSENVLIDLDSKRADGTPVVKLCDFDHAVPLRSFLHTCCISHRGIPPPDVCVGTPRWMAPEVLRAMHKSNLYGLEVDVWSYGCLLLELLTLQVPYSGLSELEIHEHLQTGKRPQLTDELEALRKMNGPTLTQSGFSSEGTDVESETLRFLIDLYYRCTEENPADRPSSENIYESLLAHTSTTTSSKV